MVAFWRWAANTPISTRCKAGIIRRERSSEHEKQGKDASCRFRADARRQGTPPGVAQVFSAFDAVLPLQLHRPLCHHISHRLSSCKFCDEIAVFHAGNIVQRGSHDELVADEGGKYRRLWTAQAQYYTETAARAEKSQNNE